MKFNCGLSPEKRAARERLRKAMWHRHFCLWPRTVSTNKDGTRNCIWLGYCERKLVRSISWCSSDVYWEYREIPPEDYDEREV